MMHYLIQEMAEAAVSDASPPRGYLRSVLFEPSMVSQFTCPLCGRLFRLPSQVECGHQFCEPCLQHRLLSNPDIRCPVCETEGDDTTIRNDNFQPDFACRKRMKKLKVRCENHESGCTWDGLLRDLDEHLTTCEHAQIKCPKCHQDVARNALDDHLATECIGGFGEATGPCEFGCTDLPPDVDLAQHNQECAARHLYIVLKAYNGVERFRIIINRMFDRVERLSQQGAGEAAVPPPADVQQTDGGMQEAVDNLKKMDMAMKTSTNLINVAFKEVQRVAARLVDLEKQFQAQFGGSANGELPERQQEIDRLSRQLSVQNVSHCGVLLWEIDGVAEKLLVAQASQHVSIDSPAFFTSQIGYKMKARIYLNGDGTGSGTYISLFIVVLKGPYDGTLKWPLNQLVRFTLFDQSGKCDHAKYSFCTDPQSSSFRRPRNETNIASGCPQFVALTEFRRRYDDFVQNDTIIVEVRLDPEGLAAFT